YRIGPDAQAAVPALIPALEDPDENIRRVSGYALKAIGPAATPAVLEALRSENRYRRLEGVKALYGEDPKAKEAIPILVQMVKEPDLQISDAAVVALGDIQPPTNETVTVLTQIAKSQGEYPTGVRTNAIIMLRAVAKAAPEAIPTLIELSESEDKSVAK